MTKSRSGGVLLSLRQMLSPGNDSWIYVFATKRKYRKMGDKSQDLYSFKRIFGFMFGRAYIREGALAQRELYVCKLRSLLYDGKTVGLGQVFAFRIEKPKEFYLWKAKQGKRSTVN